MLENEQAALDDAIRVLEVVNDIHDARHSLREEAAVPHPS
jgi:hypothetical protein